MVWPVYYCSVYVAVKVVHCKPLMVAATILCDYGVVVKVLL